MTTATKAKARKTTTKTKKSPAESAISLPESTSAIEIEGKRYLVTPEADMTEWLEDMEDILDSRAAMNEPGESIPLEQVVKELGITLPARRK